MTKTEIAALPRELPAKPERWRERMVMHLNRGRDGHHATLEIFDASGMKMPFVRIYDTHPKAPRAGFVVIGRDKTLSWSDLRQHWSRILTWLEEQATE